MPAFIHRGRVAFHETDAAGIVHFSNFFRYAEEAETAARATLGLTANALSLYMYPRVRVEATYAHPLRFFEAYEIHTTITHMGESSLHWRFDICGEHGGKACVLMVSARRFKADGSRAPYSTEELAGLRQFLTIDSV